MAVAASHVPEWRAQFEEAVRQFAAGAIAEAEALYLAVMAYAPNHVEAYIGAAHCARKRGDHQASLAHFQAVKAVTAVLPWMLLEIASDLRALGRLDDAEAQYHEVLATTPDDLYARLGLAHCARQRGNHKASLALFQAVMETLPATPWAQLEVAADLRELGRFDEAEARYRAVLVLEPNSAYARMGLGHCARHRGDRHASLALFQAAIADAPHENWARLEAAADLRELGRLDEAEATCREILAIDPGNAFGLLGLGHCARARGDRATAMAHFQAAAQAAPDEPWGWIEVAFEQREAGEIEAARQTARAVLTRHPHQLQAMLSLAHTERAAGQHAAALAAFEHAHRAYPEQEGILVDMALEERHLGNQANCDQYLEQALTLDPGHITALSCSAEQALIAGDIETAHAVYQKAASTQPGELTFQLGLQETLAAMGQTDAALAGLEKLEEKFGPAPLLRVKRIRLLREAGYYPAALRLARQATTDAPQSFWLWVERLHTEMLVGEGAAIEACLRDMPATNMQERATRRRFAGALAENHWRLEEAVRHYEAAAMLNPEDSGVQYSLLRTKILLKDLAGARVNLRNACALDAHYVRLRGRSLNISQTLYGQILDDYCLDQDMALALAQLEPLPPAQRAIALRALMRDNPDNTAAAISLVVALRQSGALHYRASGQGGAIPKTITQFWDSETPPRDVVEIMASWAALNLDYTVTRFNDASADAYLATHCPESVRLAYRRVREPAQRADLFRLALLVTEGGVYADADDRCLKPVNAIIPADASLVLYQEDQGTLGNNFMAAAPRHPVLETALRMAVAAMNRGDADIVWLSTGPGLLTRAFGQVLAANPALAPTAGTAVLDRRALYQAVGVHCTAGYKNIDRHWSNTAFARRRKASKSVDDGYLLRGVKQTIFAPE
jgi:tetratricopeptide (TPR) repeat protein